MPLYIYLGKDLHDQLQEFKHSHEVDGFRKIAMQLWNKFAHQEKEYALIANLRKTGSGRELTPDAVIISELGLGFMELKHSFGEINCSDPKGTWYAGNSRIKPHGGSSSKFTEEGGPYTNPHKQIQDYAGQTRRDLMRSELHNWVAGQLPDDQVLKVHTAVCFTNPAAVLTKCKQSLQARYFPPHIVKPWENFTILAPSETAEWALNLRFGVDLGPADWYQPIILPSGEVRRLAEQFFGGVEWKEMVDQMYLRRAPYGYLALVEGEQEVQYFHLDQDDLLIGRSAEVCNIVIPGKFTNVSRKHARLVHTAEGAFLEDQGSQNNSFIDGKRVIGRRLLRSSEQVITLGGPQPGETTCQLRYLTQISPPGPTGLRSQS